MSPNPIVEKDHAALLAKGVLYLRCRVTPYSSQTALKEVLQENIDGVDETTYVLTLKAPPEQGKANRALCSFLSELFCVQQRYVEVMSGKTSRLKLVRILSS